MERQLPERIGRLRELANNLWWSWHLDARQLFERLDGPLWRLTVHNPVRLLTETSEEHLEEASRLPSFLELYDHVMRRFDNDMSAGETWYSKNYPELTHLPIAYFSFEFGLHNSIPIYSGGLGILSGDHCKEASDLGLPFVAVGFMYPQGYFRQRLGADGRQEAIYQQLDINTTPFRRAVCWEGQECLVTVQLEQPVHAAIWELHVGRTKLYLLDTDVGQNSPWDRELSARLYGGDQETRLRQEIVLGIGGVRALKTLGIRPAAWHMNEGHSALLTLERARQLVEEGMSFEQAVEILRTTTIFTTHTPVAAGHDSFPFHLIEKYFSHYWDLLGLTREEFLQLGAHQESWGTGFNLTVLAFHLGGYFNGVSKLHGKVTRRMWKAVWPELEEDDLPITHVTNGVHTPTWIAPELDQLYREYLGEDWTDAQDDPSRWDRILEIPDAEFWQVKQLLKHKLMSTIRERARKIWIEGGNDPAHALITGALLDPMALTIGFARRFATYKRATLMFRDPDRLQRILHSFRRPVQIIYAGKAHPADEPGKHLVHQVVELAKNHELGGRIAFVEDYDINLARYLVQGVDIWLNNPLPPYEASGTSGQKAAVNGAPNLSVLDGWWMEAYNGKNGWVIGKPPSLDPVDRDESDVESLYRLLEEEIVPRYYQRDPDGVPRAWIQIVKEAVRSNAPVFCTRRMVKEYADRMYVPAARYWQTVLNR